MQQLRSLLPVVLVLWAGACVGQSYFQQAYGPLVLSGAFQTSRAVRHADGSWTMRGSVDDPSTLLHLNADGGTQWIRAFNSPQVSSLGSISATAAGPDNSTIVVFIDTLENIGQGMSRRHIGVARIAVDGTVEWARRHRYDVPGMITLPSAGHRVAVNADGSFFLDGGEPSAPSVMRFNNNGTLTWARTLNEPDGVGRFMGLAADGTGGCYFLAGYTTQFQDSSTVIVGQLNSSGVLVWNTKISSAATGRVLEPLNLLKRADGNLLITAREYGGGVLGTSGVLLQLGPTGTLQFANEYWHNSSGTLYIYNTLERSDGQLWMDFQASGYGFARLDAQGAVQEAERFTYQNMGNSTGVVAWEETLMHNDELGVIGSYFIDVNGTSNDPRTEFVWNLNAFDLGLCLTDPVTLTRNELPGAAFLFASTTTAAPFTVTEEPMTVSATDLSAPSTLPFCPLYVGVDDLAASTQLQVQPTLVHAGEAFTLQSSALVDVQVVDACGRTMVQHLSLAPQNTHTISTAGWARGLYLLRASGRNAVTVGTIKVVVD
jgi:hypothetical protein